MNAHAVEGQTWNDGAMLQPASLTQCLHRALRKARAGAVAGAVRAAVLLLVLSGGTVLAAPVVQDFYVPMPEAQIQKAFTTIRTGAGTNMMAVISIVVTQPGTVITYDQWEDGYETDINNPTQATTRVWGDGNDAHGIPPGFTHNPVGLPAGTVIVLTNNVGLPRNPSTILYDARDRIGATKAITVSRACWGVTPGTVQASAVEVLSTMNHGTSYVVPVGQNVSFNNMFQYVGLLIMADQDGTTVTITPSGTNTAAATSFVLNRGESYQVNGGVLKDTTVIGTKPIQVHMITGNQTVSYESRSYVLRPTSIWDSRYLTAVGTAPNGNQAYAFLYSTNAAPLTVNYKTLAGTGTLTIPGGGNGLLQWQLPQNSGTLFQNPGGTNFFVICACGAQPGNSAAYDWGFSLMPFEGLTTEAVIGWGPGSSDGTADGSPAWVTALAATTIYVDYKGDGTSGPLIDPAGGHYNTNYIVSALQSLRVFNPSKDQTGMRLYTLDGTSIAAMWGEDPSTAQPGNPYLDMGTIAVPFPTPKISKTSTLLVDNPPAGLSTNDVLLYTVTVDNAGLLPLGNVVVLDPLPSSLSYITNSTALNGTAISDDFTGSTKFPLDESGYTIPIILGGGSSVFTYQCRVVSGGSITNAGMANAITVTNVVYASGGVGATSTPATIQFTVGANGAVTNMYLTNGTVYVRVTDLDQNISTTAVDTVYVTVSDGVSGDYETFLLTETGVNTGIFTGSVPASVSSGLMPGDGTLNAPAGSVLTAQFTDSLFPANAVSTTATIVTPPMPTLTKVLYLDQGQTLTREDPVATGDSTVTNTVGLSNGSGSGTSAIVVDNVSTGRANATSLTISHTTGTGTNRLMLVGISSGVHETGFHVTNITYGAQTLTLATTNDYDDGSYEARTEIWKLVSPNSGTANVVIQGNVSRIFVAGVSTFTGVDQTTPIVRTNGAHASSGSASVAVTNGDLFYGVICADNGSPSATLTSAAGQTNQWHSITNNGNSYVSGACDIKTGTTGSTALSWTNSANSYWVASAVSLNASATSGGSSGGTNSVTFTQSPPFQMPFSLPSGSTIAITNYIAVTNGTMPASPNITAALGTNGVSFLTLSNPVYSVSGSSSTLVWSATLPGTVSIATNQAITLTVQSAQTGVVFQILYDSRTYPSKILLPTTNVIAIASLGVYSAPYPSTNQVIVSPNGATLYIRTTVTDPFGSYDISSNNLVITGPAGAATASVALSSAYVAATNAYSTTYEYAWNTVSVQGLYTIAATAWEGTEGINATASTTEQLAFGDQGTPSTTTFTTGANGPATTSYPTNQTVFVRVSDADQNLNTAVVESVSAVITNLSNGDSETVVLWETGPNTGIFTGSVVAVASGTVTPSNGTLTAPAGSILKVTYVDPTDPSDVSSATATVPTAPGVPGLSVQKTLTSPSSGQILLGGTAQYSILVINSGSTTQGTVSVTDTLPTGLGFLSATPTPDTNASSKLTWNNVGPLIPGQQASISVSCTGNVASAAATNVAVAMGGTLAATGTAVVAVLNPAVQVIKTLVSPTNGPASVGTQVVYRIVVRNTGNTTITSLPLQDTFSGELYQFVSSTIAPDGSGSGSLVWNNLGPLAVGAAITNTVTMQVTGAGNPAYNTAAATFVYDALGNAVPDSSSTTGLVTLAALISGTVYYDVKTNGTYNTNDYGIANVPVTLYRNLGTINSPTNGALVGAGTTLANGTYQFLNLPTGNYVVVESDLPGYASTGDSVPPNDNRIPLNVTNLVAYTNNNFFDYLPPIASYSTISGTVWNDLRATAVYATNDTGIANAQVSLVQDINGNGIADPGDPVIQSVPAGTNGQYSFAAVPTGRYVVVETDLPGYVSTTTNQLALLVTSGSTLTNNNFLDTQPTTVSGGVYVDINGNRIVDAGDTNGIAGVTVQLLNASSNVVATSTTTVSGAYAFTNVLPGSYMVKETDLPGYISTTQTGGGTSNLVGVTVTSGTSVPGINFYDSGVGALGGYVFADINNNHAYDAGEGLTSVSVTVTGDLYGNGTTQSVVVATGTNGYWSVPNLRVSATGVAYTVTVNTNTLPAGLTLNTVNPGGGSNSTATVTLTVAAPASLNLNFGYRSPAVYTISGQVLSDLYGNGNLTATNRPLENVVVSLYSAGGALLATTLTTTNGGYSFTNLIASSYVVVETDPAHAVSTADSSGPNDNRVPVALVNANSTGNNFLDMIDPAGFLYDTADGRIVPGGLVQVVGPGGVIITNMDGSNGEYIFNTAGNTGTYTIVVTPPPGYMPDPGRSPAGASFNPTGYPDPTVLGAGESTNTPGYLTSALAGSNQFYYVFTLQAGAPIIANNNFPLIRLPSLGDFVWNDLNGNGIQDAGEPGISNVTVNLLDTSNNVLSTTLTDTNGIYAFTNLAPAIYRVQFVAPGGFVFTVQNAGTNAAVDSDADPATGLTAPITLLPGQADTTRDAGLYRPATLIGYAFADQNNNLVYDNGDLPCSNLTVHLVLGGTQLVSTVTGTNGEYQFTGLEPGSYTVVFGIQTNAAALALVQPVPTSPPASTNINRIRAVVSGTNVTASVVVVSGDGVLPGQGQPIDIGFAPGVLASSVHIRAYATAEGVLVEFQTVDETGQNPISLYLMQNGQWVLIGTNAAAGYGNHTYSFLVPGLRAGDLCTLLVVDDEGKYYTVYDLPVRSFAAQAVLMNENGLWLQWAAIPGRRYQIYSANQIAGPWTLTTSVIATNSVNGAFLSLLPGSSAGFYKIVQQ